MVSQAIILRDLPNGEARLCLFKCPILDGFLGFSSEAPLIGWQYISAKVNGKAVGFWYNISPHETVVRVFEPERGWLEVDDGTRQTYADRVESGALDDALIAYPIPYHAHWFGLTDCLDFIDLENNFPPQIHAEDLGTGSRFEKALLGTHGGDRKSFLGELQYAFLHWWMSLDTGTIDKFAFARWQHLLLSIYNAGEVRMAASGDLFVAIVNVLIRQLALLPPDWFKPDTFVTAQANYLIEDLVDTEIAELVGAAQAFERCLNSFK